MKYLAVFVVGALLGALSAVQVVPATRIAGPAGSTNPNSGDGGIGGVDPSPGDIVPSGLPSVAPTGADPTAPRPGLKCAAGANGGSTDRGVTGGEIKMAATVVDSGIGASFLRDVRFAMEAVRIKVNRGGGICGRRLTIRYIDDGWDAQKGAQFLRNLILEPDPKRQIFAIPVGPSSEGLRVVINSRDIDNSKTPVVGTDGLLIEQYQTRDGAAQPWVWPVAAATVASARIMAKDAFDRGAKAASDFSVVFDKNYRFGVEGALAFNAEVKRLTGGNIPGFNAQYSCRNHFCGIQAGQSSYSSQVATFNPGKYVALFLEPQTALTWMNDPNTEAANDKSSILLGYGAAMPLFTRDFAVNCQSKCDQMQIWTSFKPYIEQYKNDPAVREYVSDLARANPQADEFNQFAQGGYVGMQLLVDALNRVGPDLTRARLKAVLDQTCLDPGLTIQSRLCWTTQTRFASTTMQKFVIQYKGTFSGWRSGPIVADPRPLAGIGA